MAWLQVQALRNVPCRAAIMRKPAPLPPGQVTSLLHPGVSDAVRTAALLATWVSDGVRWMVGALDRQNATGTQDDLKVSAIGMTILHRSSIGALRCELSNVTSYAQARCLAPLAQPLTYSLLNGCGILPRARCATCG